MCESAFVLQVLWTHAVRSQVRLEEQISMMNILTVVAEDIFIVFAFNKSITWNYSLTSLNSNFWADVSPCQLRRLMRDAYFIKGARFEFVSDE